MRHSKSNKIINKQEGFTLTELLVGITISVVVSAAAMTALTTTTKATRVNDQTAQTQQNARVAMELLSHDIKMAGYGMTGPVANCPSAIVPADNTVGGPDTGPDSVSLVIPTVVSPLASAVMAPFGASTTPLPLVSATGFSANSVISIGGVISATVAAPPSGNNLTLGAIVGAPATFPAATPVYVLRCVTYQVMQTGGANAAAICGANLPCLARGMDAPLVAGKLDCNGVGGATACVSISEGIEDLQLAYACDGCNAGVNGGIADYAVDDQGAINNTFEATDFVSNNTWTTAPMTADTIRLVSINIVARETRVEQGFGERNATLANTTGPVVVLDHNPSTPGDAGYSLATYQQFRRRLVTRTVEVRNIGL